MRGRKEFLLRRRGRLLGGVWVVWVRVRVRVWMYTWTVIETVSLGDLGTERVHLAVDQAAVPMTVATVAVERRAERELEQGVIVETVTVDGETYGMK